MHHHHAPAAAPAAALRHLQTSDPRFEAEGVRQLTITTPHLGGRGDITLFVPPAVRGLRNVPLVILLHGVYGSHWAWTADGGAHRTAARLIAGGEIPPLVLAMPSDGLWGEGSGYVPHLMRNYELWIVDDVPATVALAEPCVGPGSPLFIAGLSMGGFGALRLGAKHAGRFQAISAHSAATHLDQLQSFLSPHHPAFDVRAEERCAFTALRRHSGRLPALRFDCGLEDPLLAGNRELHQKLVSAGIPHVYEEFSGGHEWSYWERHLVDTLRFFAAHCPPAGSAPGAGPAVS